MKTNICQHHQQHHHYHDDEHEDGDADGCVAVGGGGGVVASGAFLCFTCISIFMFLLLWLSVGSGGVGVRSSALHLPSVC